MNRIARYGLLLSLYDALAETLNKPSNGLELAGTGLTRLRKGGAESMDSITAMRSCLNSHLKIVYMHTALSLQLVYGSDGTTTLQKLDWDTYMTYNKLIIPVSQDGTLQSILSKALQVWNCPKEQGALGMQEIFLPATMKASTFGEE